MNSSAESDLPLPNRLLRLLDLGRWPRSSSEAQRQNLKSLVPSERIHLFAPEEQSIYLLAPPLRTVAAEIAEFKKRFGVDRFWAPYTALESISPELSIVIGDFGLGSDAPILLDYRYDRSNPTVLRLRWHKPEANVWVKCANTFDEFADMLGLD